MPIENQNFTLAIYTEFFDSIAKLPKKQRDKILSFVTKFRMNPKSSAINLEKINAKKDNNIYSVRIDDDYRGIVVRDDDSRTYILIWVDHHNQAYAWAARKKCQVNPKTGVVQLYDVKEADSEPRVSAASEPAQPQRQLFRKFSDDILTSLGVPSELLPLVRGFADEEALQSAKSELPRDSYEVLEFLACGFSVQEIRDFQNLPAAGADEAPEAPDLAKALRSDGSRSAFVVVEGEDELRRYLSEPLEKWRVFLHPTQRKLVSQNFKGPCRITGGAGTGKTVVAMHRAKWLAGQENQQKILFTTFSTTLAEDIRVNLKKICNIEEFKRIEVINLDSWVFKYVKRQNYNFKITYDDNKLLNLWEEALSKSGVDIGLDLDFFKDEWLQVVLGQDIFTEDEYMRASRLGRGTQLDRKKRKEVWKVFQAYIDLMKQNRLRDIDSAMRECFASLKNNKDTPTYSSIVVDEAQDLSANAYRLLRAMAGEQHPNDLFIVGDAHQRIYNKIASLYKCGINIQGRGKFLRLNYRTTEEIRRQALSVLSGVSFDDLDGQPDEDARCRSLTHGPLPTVMESKTLDAEAAFIVGEIKRLASEGTPLQEICIVARINHLLDKYEKALANEGLEVFELKHNQPDDLSRDGVRLTSMHRVKGLEFSYVFIVSVNDRIVPWSLAVSAAEPAVRKKQEISERCLLYVAMTRAKKGVYLTSYGEPSEFIGKFLKTDG